MEPLDLCYLGAAEAVALFRRRELSPVELLQAQVDRAQRLEPTLNAFCALRTEQALLQARAAERAWMREPERARPLEGIPTALKNEHLLAGEHTDQGSLLLGAAPDPTTAPIVQRMLDAGAVIHARTNVPEFCVAAFTRTRRYGVTRNPWNPAITPGGSSGGAGAALAAGLTTLATASDIGGSIRVPAAYCGVVGLKPSYGRVPESSMLFAMNAHNHNGVLARSVVDCAMMFNEINGPHRADPASVRPAIRLPLESAPVAGVRIALSVDLGFFDVDPRIARNTRAAAARLAEMGAIVEEVALGWTRRAATAFTDGLVFVLGRALQRMVGDRAGETNDYVRAMIARAQSITLDDYLDSFDEMERMHAALQDVLERHDALLCPTLARNRTPAEGVPAAHEDLLDNAMTYPFNMLSRHPVLAVPSGFGDNGVPTGVQIVGPTFDEARVLQIGAALETAIGWPRWRPDTTERTEAR